MAGAAGDDTLIGLGEVERDIKDTILTFDDLIADPVVTNKPERFEEMLGDGDNVPTSERGADVFNLRNASDDEGRLFVKGQIYALIKDFRTAHGDKIRLPGLLIIM